MSIESLHEISSLTKLIENLKTNIHKYYSIKNLCASLKNYNGLDWYDYIKYSDISYQKIYIYRDEIFDIIIICWKKGQHTKIHDHPERGCLMKILYGNLIENTFIMKENELKNINTNELTVDDVGYKESNVILHNIYAPVDSVSIHIYCPGNYIPKYYQ